MKSIMEGGNGEQRSERGRKNSFRPDSQAGTHWEKYFMQLQNSKKGLKVFKYKRRNL